MFKFYNPFRVIRNLGEQLATITADRDGYVKLFLSLRKQYEQELGGHYRLSGPHDFTLLDPKHVQEYTISREVSRQSERMTAELMVSEYTVATEFLDHMNSGNRPTIAWRNCSWYVVEVSRSGYANDRFATLHDTFELGLFRFKLEAVRVGGASYAFR